jgi:polyphosphate glucokinase
MKVLVIDVGGTHVKLLATGRKVPLKIVSGPDMSARQMVAAVLDATRDWGIERISIGYPGPVLHGRPVSEPHNLGPGWVGFDFSRALGHPVKIINDAAMQALGAYRGGRMLFLGLGTGLGSALIVDGRLEPMELAHLPYKRRTYEDYLGASGLKRRGKKKWRRDVLDVALQFKAALGAEDIVLGGGNAKKLGGLPEGMHVGGNADAFVGGFSLWKEAPKGRPGPKKKR